MGGGRLGRDLVGVTVAGRAVGAAYHNDFSLPGTDSQAALDPGRVLQQFGLGLAIAVLVDAAVIRCLLLPAVMQLLGGRAWWLPAGLVRRLPRVALEHNN
ncbi:MAG TPA: MMPL family transporter [Micromonosporaceae bacterium]